MLVKKFSISKVIKLIKLYTNHLRVKTVYALDLSRADTSGLRLSDRVSFKEGEAGDLQELSKGSLDYDPLSIAFAKERLKHGDKLIIGYLDLKPVCYGWLMYNQMDLQFRNYHALPEGVAYSYKIYVDPGVRRKGVFQAYYRYVIDYLQEQNQRFLLTWIDDSNQASVQAHLKFGLKPIGKINSRTRMGIKSHKLVSDDPFLNSPIANGTPS